MAQPTRLECRETTCSADGASSRCASIQPAPLVRQAQSIRLGSVNGKGSQVRHLAEDADEPTHPIRGGVLGTSSSRAATSASFSDRACRNHLSCAPRGRRPSARPAASAGLGRAAVVCSLVIRPPRRKGRRDGCWARVRASELRQVASGMDRCGGVAEQGTDLAGPRS